MDKIATTTEAQFLRRHHDLARHMESAYWFTHESGSCDDVIAAEWRQYNWARAAEDCAQLAALATRLADAAGAAADELRRRPSGGARPAWSARARSARRRATSGWRIG